jgi:glycosyltransferase involved in cell wall biosynthesis
MMQEAVRQNATSEKLTISVLIPTYKRPDYLERCVRSLFIQSLPPDEIIIVSRDTDTATRAKIEELQAELGPTITIKTASVSAAGFLPPVQKGIELASMDIVALIDDDAEALPEWLESLIANYSSPHIGAVGGRCINYSDFKLVEYPPVDTVGKLRWFGRMTGDMYKDTTFRCAVEVDFLMGGNMSFRRELGSRVNLDLALNRNVGFYWELDFIQQIKHLGFTVLFDPNVRVNHYTAPREITGMRAVNYDGIYWSNFNYAYLMMKHLPAYGKIAFPPYTFLVGGSGSSGVVRIIFLLLRRREIDWRNDVLASFKGRIDAIRAYCFG